ncbi:MAG: sulfotransferase family 2 domain-containing protein [Saprospiraceae bacterium]|nr:sulfotransferase family 2 domain-containing protein [Saprospiraceae bacterium]
MIELISIHIPKTAGTSFYKVLSDVYRLDLSPGYRRMDLQDIMDPDGQIELKHLTGFRVVHGHFRYAEIRSLHTSTNARIITWLRHPADRVISNYRFFIDRLAHPGINPEVSRINQHRRNERLMEYARLPENRNRMAYFLEGLNIDDIYFCGLQEYFEHDLTRLAKKLDWPAIPTPMLNTSRKDYQVTPHEYDEICALNEWDMVLYNRAQFLRDAELNNPS